MSIAGRTQGGGGNHRVVWACAVYVHLEALSVELSGERRDGAWDDSEHRVGVIGRLRF